MLLYIRATTIFLLGTYLVYMKANANDYSALDPVQDKALGAQRWDFLISRPFDTVAIVNPTDEKLINPTLWGEEYIATQS